MSNRLFALLLAMVLSGLVLGVTRTNLVNQREAAIARVSGHIADSMLNMLDEALTEVSQPLRSAAL